MRLKKAKEIGQLKVVPYLRPGNENVAIKAINGVIVILRIEHR